MKYYNLHIDFEPSWETYNKVTAILGKTPQKHEKAKFDTSEVPAGWWFQITENEETIESIDFINGFMDLLEPNFSDLEKLGIQRDNILIWLVYEYQHQCALGFDPLELERLGKNGIALNVDCHERKK
jgi:hypothetical protein